MPGEKRKQAISRAVAAGVEAWGAGSPAGTRRAAARRVSEVRAGLVRQAGSADAPESADDALAYLDELMQSPLGQAWIKADVIQGGRLEVDGESAGRPGVVAPLPRRERIGSALEQTTGVPPMMRSVEFRAGLLATIGRVLVWYLAMFRYLGLVTWDALRGRDSATARAVRLREAIERLGPTFIKLGQQLALRADLLPYEYCAELGKLLDAVKPFPSHQAIAAIERTVGKPIGEIFAVFDPNPIGSASISCVYQAMLHDGRLVAVKVRRPGIVKVLAADVNAIDWMFRIAEALTLQKPGSTKGLRYDMRAMLVDELNFWQEARATDLFRRLSKDMRDKVVTAPEVFFDLSGEDVLVTEFVGGVFLYEVLNAIDRKDEVALEQLRVQGIDPRRIAQNLMMTFNWETLEGILFHADPHPANIVVRPDNTLVFIDFGACGRFSSKTRRLYVQFYNHIVREDVGAMVDVSLSMLEPLPPIDLDAFSKELEAVYWDWLYAMKSDHSEWWEKATGVVWMRLTDISRRYEISMNLDTLRQFRATFLYDTIIYRLHDGLEFDREMVKYFRSAGRAARKKITREVRKRWEKGLSDEDYLAIGEAARMVSQTASLFQGFLDKPRHSFSALVDKAAFAFTMVIELGAIFAMVHAASILGHWIYGKWTGQEVSAAVTLERFLDHPLYQVMLYAVVLLVIRKILMRLGEVDIRR